MNGKIHRLIFSKKLNSEKKKTENPIIGPETLHLLIKSSLGYQFMYNQLSETWVCLRNT